MSLSDFVYGKELGTGSFGSVVIVQRKEDKKTYAMKRVKISQLSTKERENSLNEVRLLASLIHKNIIGYKEAFFDSPSETLNIVMEFADDGDIASKIKNNLKYHLVFEENTIWNWLIQILQGLKYLHDTKIMHRDLKSANIFLTKEGLVKIGDLNVSKLAKIGMSKTQTGTPYYCAPEIWEGQQYDFKCDIWSVGCIIYELATLFPPFRGRSLEELFQNIKRGIYSPISKRYSTDLNKIISIMLITSPSKRPSCDELLNTDIIKKKSHEIKGLLEKLKETMDGQGMKALLMKTIKLPRNMNEINNNLPEKRYGKKQKKKNREEMMMNDEYETQKTQFFQTLKIQNEIEKKKDNEKKKEDKIKNDEKEQKEPIKMKENNKKESNYINNNGNLKNHSKSINPKEDSQNTNNASRFEMKKITIVPQKLYRNDIDFNQDYKNPTPGGPDIVKKEEKNVNNSENSTQSNSKININMSNIPSLYNNNKNQFLKYNLVVQEPINNNSTPVQEEEKKLIQKKKEIDEIKQKLNNFDNKHFIRPLGHPLIRLNPPPSAINVHGLKRKNQNPYNLQNKYINEQFILFRKNLKNVSNNNLSQNRKIVIEKMGYKKEGENYKLIRLPSRGNNNNKILRPTLNHNNGNNHHPIKIGNLAANREMFVNNVNKEHEHFKIKRLYSNK